MAKSGDHRYDSRRRGLARKSCSESACRHRTRVIRTAKFSTSGAIVCAASMTVASTHPVALADHSGILTDRPISEGSKVTDCMMVLPGTLIRCRSVMSGARSNSNGSLLLRPTLDISSEVGWSPRKPRSKATSASTAIASGAGGIEPANPGDQMPPAPLAGLEVPVVAG